MTKNCYNLLSFIAFGCCLFCGKHIFEDVIYRLTRYKLVIVVEYLKFRKVEITIPCFNPLAHCFYCLDAPNIGRGDERQ